MYILKIFNKKWILLTIIVAGFMVLFVRLGFWQLDRWQQKIDYNTRAAERWQQPPFDLNGNTLPDDLAALEFRRVQAYGTFDYARQIALTVNCNEYLSGVHLVTPLVLEENRAVLVNRGCVPLDQADPTSWPQFEEMQTGTITGLIQASQPPPNGQQSTPPAAPQRSWFRIDIPAIQAQLPYELESGWIWQLPEPGRSAAALPLRMEPMALNEGNHLSYAIQWFAFVAIAGFGYIMFVRYRERKAAGLHVAPQVPAMPAESTATPGEEGDLALPAVQRDSR